MTDIPPHAHPADSSIWATKPVCSSPFNHIGLVVFCGTIDVYDADGVRSVGYRVHEYTNTKMAMPRFVINRARFFDWFEPHVLTELDKRRRV